MRLCGAGGLTTFETVSHMRNCEQREPMTTHDQPKTNGNPKVVPDLICGDEVSLLACGRVVARHKWMIVLPAMIAAIVTGLICINRPRVYMATVAIVPPIDILQKQTEFSGGLGGLGGLGGAQSMLKGVLSMGGIGDLYMGMLKSRVVADAIIDRFDLLHVYERVKTRADVRKRLDRNSKIEVSRRDGIVHVSVRDRDPNRAAAMANAYVEELDLQNKRLSESQAQSKRIFVENRLKQIKEELSRIDTLPTHEARIKEMIFELLARECEIARMEEAKSMPTIQVLDRAAVPERPEGRGAVKKAMLAGIVMVMAGLLVAFGWEYIAGLRAMKLPAAAGQQ